MCSGVRVQAAGQGNQLFISAIMPWEIALGVRRGTIKIAGDVLAWIADSLDALSAVVASLEPAGAMIIFMATEAAPATTRRVDVAAIRSLLERIVARWDPQQVWLFGSRARGDSTPESDWDLFVVVDDGVADDELDPGVGRRLRRECGVRADVIPWRASEFAEFQSTPNTLAYSVAKDGVLLHER